MQEAETQPKRTSVSTKTYAPVEDRKVVLPQYPLVRYSDLPEAMEQDMIDIIGESTERYGRDPEEAAKAIKERVDKTFSPNWHVVVGESFAFDVSYEPTRLLYVYTGSLATAIWKCD